MKELNYDVIIIGAGPSGITAGIYAKRSGLKTLIIEKDVIGGQVINTFEIKNFPAYTKISGPDFATKLYEQLTSNELEIEYGEVLKVDFSQKIKKIFLKNCVVNAKAVIICVGAKVRPLNLENEQNLIGHGISYCAICDGNFFKDKIVAVTGGGDSALEDSVYLSTLCKKVYVIVRKERFKGQQVLIDNLNLHKKQNLNIEILYNNEIVELNGQNKLEGVKIKNNLTNEIGEIKVDGLFVAIGRIPATEFLVNTIDLDKNGYIVVDDKAKTSIEGVFASGDCTNFEIKQIITASSSGAIAATFANNYIKKNF